MQQDWLFQPGTSFQLCEQTIDIVNVFRAFNFRNHENVEFVAGFGDNVNEVVEEPW